MLPIYISIGGMVFFGLVAISLALSEERTKREILKRDGMQKRRLYEIATLKAMQDRISYSLDVEKVVDIMISSLKNLFPYSTASSLILQENKLIFKCFIEEQVNAKFIEQVKKSMLASLASLLDNPLPSALEEVKLGIPIEDGINRPLASFFHIPLVVNGNIAGLISVSSTQPGLYKDEDMTILYQMTTQASTELTKLREVINTEENKLLAMIKSLADGIFMVDNMNKLTLINEQALKLLDITTPNPTIFDVVSKLSVRFDFSARLSEAMRESKIIQEEEVSIGDHIVQIIITPVIDTAVTNAVIGASVMLHDVTLEKHLARLKEDFTSAIVHELRSPLTAIKAGSELMLTEYDKLDTEQKSKLLDIIHKQSVRMLTDINSLLDAAKLESGHFPIFQKATTIQDLLQDSLALFAPEAKEKHISISLDVDADTPRGFVDATRISEVINNLVSNSLKFTPAGGSIMIKSRRHFNEYLPKTKTNPGIIISVADSGIGIPQEKQGKLFNKFAQIENVGQIQGVEGTGLGLYIAKGIVEAHGGSIFLQSIPGHGTTVSFTLPIAQPQMQTEQTKQSSLSQQQLIAPLLPTTKMVN